MFLIVAVCAAVIAADSISMACIAVIGSSCSINSSSIISSSSTGGISVEIVAGVVEGRIDNHAVCACRSVTATRIKLALLQMVSLGVEWMGMVSLGVKWMGIVRLEVGVVWCRTAVMVEDDEEAGWGVRQVSQGGETGHCRARINSGYAEQ